MENILISSSKPIDIINNQTIYVSYNSFIQQTPTASPDATPSQLDSPIMKKSLSLDNFWPNTPPSFSPNENMLNKLKHILNKST